VVGTRSGFTYVELVAVVLTISVFTLAFLPGVSVRRGKSLQTRCVSNLQHIGLALQLYAEAQQDTLPGPVSPIVGAAYDESSSHELSWYLAESLGCPQPSTNTFVARVLICPAYKQPCERPGLPDSARTYALNENVSKKPGVSVPPFGRVQPPASPLRLSTLAMHGSPARLFATTDADKGTVSPRLPSWKHLPYRPAHGTTRSRLFFDGHVEVKQW
jgi:prepilin-type processing-associated H-X9-DG protein